MQAVTAALEGEVRELRRLVERHERQISGENHYYKGLLERVTQMERILAEIRDAQDQVKRDLEDERERQEELRERKSEREKKRDRIFFVFLSAGAAGGITAFFGFISNVVQTYLLLP